MIQSADAHAVGEHRGEDQRDQRRQQPDATQERRRVSPAILKMNGDRIACAMENTTTATTNPDSVTDTPGISHAATSNPTADDARNTATRSRSRTMVTM